MTSTPPTESASTGNGDATIEWWLGSYSPSYIGQNQAFLTTHADVVTGVFHCCRGIGMLPNGSLTETTASVDGPFFKNLTAFEKSRQLTPVLIPISPNAEAMLAGVASRSVNDLAALPSEFGFDGLVVDYEPHDNLTSAHAADFASWLKALSSALHAKGHTLAVCVSDWGKIGPEYYKLLSSAGADRYVSMGSTYKNSLEIKVNVDLMVASFPIDTITVGLGTMVPSACRCVYGNSGNCTGNYEWTEDTLGTFVSWVHSKSIKHLAIWRSDIYPAYCIPEGVEQWTYPILKSFLSNGSQPISEVISDQVTLPSVRKPSALPPAFDCPVDHCWCHDSVSNNSILVEHDITYGSSLNRLTGSVEPLLLDVYLPPSLSTTNSTSRPVALIIHGGGWMPSNDHNGKSEKYIVDRALAFARRGFVAVSIDYVCERPYGGSYLWTDAVANARQSLAWLGEQQKKLNIDTSRIVAYGTSAGAINVEGLCYMIDPNTSSHPKIRAGISISGCLFNDTVSLPTGRHVWNHLYSASADSPPMVDFHGTADPVVPYSNASARGGPNNTEGKRNQSCSAVDTQTYLTKNGAESSLIPIPGAGHVPISELYIEPYNTSFWGFVLEKLQPTPGMCH